MLSFKLKKANHDKVSRVSKFLCTVGFVGIVVFSAYTAISSYIKATSILSDHSVVDAALAFEYTTEERRKRGRVSTTYHFLYQFSVEGVDYEGRFTTSESNSDKFLDAATIAVAYSNSDHALFDRLELLERNNDFMGILGRLALAFLGFAFLMSLLHLLMTEKLFVLREEDREPEQDEELADDPAAMPESHRA